MSKILILISSIILSILPIAHVQETDFHPYTLPSQCTPAQFYDTTNMKCTVCPQDTIQSSTDATTCMCKSGYRKLVDYGGYSLTCEQCPDNQVADPSGWMCIACASGNTNCSQCNANAQQFLHITDIFGNNETEGAQCDTCAEGHIASSSPRTCCVPCPKYTYTDDCACTGGVRTGGVCFTQSADKQILAQLQPESSAQSTIKYANGEMVDSFYIRTNMRAAYVLCQKGNASACQLLANLCVLVNFAKPTGTEGPCVLYDRLRQGGAAVGPTSNRYTLAALPQLYATDSAALLIRTRIPTSYTTEKGHLNSRLRLRLAEYALNGSFLGWVDPAPEGTLQLCASDRSTQTEAYTFGTFFTLTCQLPLTQLWRVNERAATSLYDAYLQFEGDVDGVTVAQLYEVFVLDRNYEDSAGQRVNARVSRQRDEDRSQWQMTKRFFLVDNVLGTDSPLQIFNGQTSARLVRFAKTVTLHIELQTTKNGHIYPPFLDIDYADVEKSQINNTVEVSFETSYSMDTQRHDKDLEISMGIVCSLGLLWAALRAWSWLRRTGKPMLDMTVILKFLIYLACSLGDVFFGIMFMTAFWIWGAYKLQNTVVYMLLTSDQEYGMLVCIYIALALKFIELVHNRVEQMLTETFFIDWEQPRGTVIPDQGEDAQVPPSAANNQPQAPVTIWRTYLIANEWNELQNYAKANLSLQLIVVLFILQVCNVESLALAMPGTRVLSDTDALNHVVRDTKLTRFAVAALIYLLVGFAQCLINVMFIEGAFDDHFRNFMDLCSMANISVLALTQSHHGYYIHGRSVHGYSDVNMKQMNDMLQRERDNLCGQRGLEPGADHQCYIVCLPPEFRKRLDALRAVLNAGQVHSTEGVNATTTKITAIVKVHEMVNTYLSAFIDQRIEGISYMIKDRRFLEAVFDVDFEDYMGAAGVFYRDISDMAYSAAFVYGNEWTNLSFDCLLFCVTDLLARDYLLAACVTFIFKTGFRLLTEIGFTRNLVRSSLVDHRFLI